jgi:hypothetical protein
METNKIRTIALTFLLALSQIVFSDNPSILFMNAKGEVANTFLAGEEIRGKINLPKPLKDYLKGETAKQIRIEVKSTSDQVSGI